MGGSGSKAVQKGAARVMAESRLPPASAAAAAAAGGAVEQQASTQRSGISAAEQQREAELRRRQQDVASMPAEQAQENEELVQSMNKAMAGMRQYQHEVYTNPQVDKLYATKKMTKQDREAAKVGRLETKVLQQLMDEHAQSVEAGTPIPTAELAKRYGVDATVLEQVLQYTAAPILYTDDSGQLTGRWPGKKGKKDEE
ncbi:hypothetical protein ACK3TF_003660 [Chlorella vulgaris]